ncbi:unnamed protein product [Calicophoron daubneyi]|uniref:Secreted protein n=1 Tax=Calicophoron daubneyi TaxID=300641 RepID=A0AAV2TYP4_CALDB
MVFVDLVNLSSVCVCVYACAPVCLSVCLSPCFPVCTFVSDSIIPANPKVCTVFYLLVSFQSDLLLLATCFVSGSREQQVWEVLLISWFTSPCRRHGRQRSVG